MPCCRCQFFLLFFVQLAAFFFENADFLRPFDALAASLDKRARRFVPSFLLLAAARTKKAVFSLSFTFRPFNDMIDK